MNGSFVVAVVENGSLGGGLDIGGTHGSSSVLGGVVTVSYDGGLPHGSPRPYEETRM